MGRDDDPMAVLDSRLRVRGIAGLRVVDAGAMPTITSGNTNSPTLMMAEKAAGVDLERRWSRCRGNELVYLLACQQTAVAQRGKSPMHAIRCGR